MKFKKRVLRAIHEIGGCDAADEWAKGYDDGVNDAYKVVEELDEDPRIWEIANYYGFTSQADMLTEEAAEFTVALNKLRRGHSDAYENIKEEVADVLVVAFQLRKLLGADEIDEIMEAKVERQINRIETTERMCNCYNNGKCWGTKDMEQCKCGGDENKCDYYPTKRRA